MTGARSPSKPRAQLASGRCPLQAAAHVFISYVEADSSVALAIAQELRQLGYQTWTYEEDGVPGHSYLEQVHSAIQSCDAFVLLASAESLKSHHVRREAETAYEQQKLVVPIRLKITQDQLHSSPIFRMVSGTAVSVASDGTDTPKVAGRIAASLRKAGFQREENATSPSKITDDVSHIEVRPQPTVQDMRPAQSDTETGFSLFAEMFHRHPTSGRETLAFAAIGAVWGLVLINRSQFTVESLLGLHIVLIALFVLVFFLRYRRRRQRTN
jgi:hypothetical protein